MVEGNPGKRPIPEPTELPPVAPDRPDWKQIFPTPPVLPKKASAEERSERRRVVADLTQCRKTADWAWDQVVPVLGNFSLLATVDVFVLIDFCRTWARMDQAERGLTLEGATHGERRDRGQVKSPWTTILNQLRTHFRALTAELGLSPLARGSGDIFPMGLSGGRGRPSGDPGKAASDLLD